MIVDLNNSTIRREKASSSRERERERASELGLFALIKVLVGERIVLSFIFIFYLRIFFFFIFFSLV